MTNFKNLDLAIKYIDVIRTIHGDDLPKLSENEKSFYAKELVKILTINPEK
jgi:hypothetical protein